MSNFLSDHLMGRSGVIRSLYAELGASIPDRGGMRPRVPCLFHADRSGDLSIDLDIGTFHCFGCRASGDVVTAWAKIRGCSIGDAIQQIKTRLGIGRGKSEAEWTPSDWQSIKGRSDQENTRAREALERKQDEDEIAAFYEVEP